MAMNLDYDAAPVLAPNALALDTYDVYTDGCNLWPHGPSGAGFVIIDRGAGVRIQESWAIKESTSQKVELTAVILALGKLSRGSRVTVYTDSQYLLDGIRKLPSLAANGWVRKRKRGARRLANAKEWKKLNRMLRNRSVEFQKVREESEICNNRLADTLAYKAAHEVARQLAYEEQNPRYVSSVRAASTDPGDSWCYMRFQGDVIPGEIKCFDTPTFIYRWDEYIPVNFIPPDPKKERRFSPYDYGTGRGAEDMLARARNPLDKPVGIHEGNHRDFLKRYVRAAHEATKEFNSGQPSPRAESFRNQLFELATSYRMLQCAWEITAMVGSLARGADGASLLDLERDHLPIVFRELRERLRSGEYKPYRLSRVYAEKPGGRGKRPIDIPTVTDRIVERALVLALSSILESSWHPCSIGFRPRHGIQDGFAMAHWLVYRHKNRVVQAVDIRRAFTSIPKERLVNAVRKAVPNEQLAELVAKIIRRPLPKGEGIRKGRGIAQGGPLSPMLLNLYLNAYLDWKWDHQRWPMIRYADDILILTHSVEEAELAVATLRNLLRPQGLNLRDEIPPAADLTTGATTEWLGLTMDMYRCGLRFSVGNGAWERLHNNLVHTTNDRFNPRAAASAAMSGWLEHTAPAYRSGGAHRGYRQDFVDRVAQSYVKAGFAIRDMPERVIHSTWTNAARRWRRRRRRVTTRLDNQGLPHFPRWLRPPRV